MSDEAKTARERAEQVLDNARKFGNVPSAHLTAMSDEQVDAVLASLGKWAKELEAVAQQIYASAAKAFAPLAALAQKYRDAS